MTRRPARYSAMALALCTGLGLLASCTTKNTTDGYADAVVPLGSYRLVSFDSCAQALRGFQAAAGAVVGPFGFAGGIVSTLAGDVAKQPGAAPPGAPLARDNAGVPAVGGAERNPTATSDRSAASHSGTNTHEAGVDEPDLIKTDGQRIVTVTNGVLRVTDAHRKVMTGSVTLTDQNSAMGYLTATDLLLAGNRALVFGNTAVVAYGGGPIPPTVDRGPAQPADGMPLANGTPLAPTPRAEPTAPVRTPVLGPRLFLVDLTGEPRVLSSFVIDGSLVDSRQVGSVARVVVRSFPRLTFPYQPDGTDASRTETNRKIINAAGIESWLPRMEVTRDGHTVAEPRIDCDAISRPAQYTGTNLLTVLTFDLTSADLTQPRPAVLAADGDTVYSTGASLYVASDQRWRIGPVPMAGTATAAPTSPRTEIYKFDTSSAGRPTFVAGGSVPGYVLNQYSMSEWDGNLRVATTNEAPWLAVEQASTRQSGVYVLRQSGGTLDTIGAVNGLGAGERIYAVRFVGTVGYVVTFRQTDPLYTVDLSRPEKPVVRGALKISGYSAYLHPLDGGRLIGIGQEANGDGRVTGLQVSLFDVSRLDSPRLVTRFTVPGGHSVAEFNPHAFLYWPATGLLVVPLETYGMGKPSGATPILPPRQVPNVGAMILRVTGDHIGQVGFITHPSPYVPDGYYPAAVERSVLIDQTLWTVSQSGLLASQEQTLARQAWIPFQSR